MIGDLSVLHAHHIHCFKLDLAVGRSNSEERPVMRRKLLQKTSPDFDKEAARTML
jgi:hypothetical protein